jgi:hypothetical protein
MPVDSRLGRGDDRQTLNLHEDLDREEATGIADIQLRPQAAAQPRPNPVGLFGLPS